MLCPLPGQVPHPPTQCQPMAMLHNPATGKGKSRVNTASQGLHGGGGYVIKDSPFPLRLTALALAFRETVRNRRMASSPSLTPLVFR